MFRTILHFGRFSISFLCPRHIFCSFVLRLPLDYWLDAGRNFVLRFTEDKMVYRRLFSLYISTLQLLISLHYFSFQLLLAGCWCYAMLCHSMLCRVLFCVCVCVCCGCSLVSLLCYYRFDRKKHSLFCVFLIFRSYPFCLFVVMIPLYIFTHSFVLTLTLRRIPTLVRSVFEQLVVWIRYIMFCLPSLMMFAIYIKIHFLDFFAFSHCRTLIYGKRRECASLV